MPDEAPDELMPEELPPPELLMPLEPPLLDTPKDDMPPHTAARVGGRIARRARW
jgi:hypothetical protein